MAAEAASAEVAVAALEDPEDREASEGREALDVPLITIIEDGFSAPVFMAAEEAAWVAL